MTDLQADLAALRIDREPAGRGVGRWVGWVVLVGVVGAGGWWGWQWLSRERPAEVEVAVVTERAAGTQAAVLNASGYVTARRRATVSSKVTGKVVEVNVEEGKAVTEGQILARLDDAMPQAALALAKAQAEAAKRAVHESEVHLERAKLTLNRMVRLQQDGFGTQADVDAAKADVDGTAARIAALREQTFVAEKQIAMQQTDLDNTIIRAPFSGIAISKDAQPGEMVSPVSAGGGFTRTGICTIVDMQSLEIEVDVNESYLERVKAGQDVTAILAAYPDWQIPAHVITIVPTADRQKATVLVRIGFTRLDPRILPDMGVKVTFLRQAGAEPVVTSAAPSVPLVPKTAVRAEGAESVVFVVRGDIVSRRTVTLGGTDGDRHEVKSGLVPGDRVVVSPPPGLKDGTRITVK